MANPARQLESLALQAVAAVDPAHAEAVWMVAFERLTALGSSSKRLIQALLHCLTGSRKGPLRVRSPCPCCSAYHMRASHLIVYMSVGSKRLSCLFKALRAFT